MAEKIVTTSLCLAAAVCFNPHHTGEWLKRLERLEKIEPEFKGFNPHHTGEWLKSC
jgi:hypothetical protein